VVHGVAGVCFAFDLFVIDLEVLGDGGQLLGAATQARKLGSKLPM
jgi:hypothetical protein